MRKLLAYLPFVAVAAASALVTLYLSTVWPVARFIAPASQRSIAITHDQATAATTPADPRAPVSAPPESLPPASLASGARLPALVTNEQFIASLYERDLDLADPMAVFRFVFSSLKDEILLYPTENYYYFQFAAQGKTIWGSIHLQAHRVADGVLGFGYIEKGQDVAAADRVGGSADLDAGDGLAVERVHDFAYDVTFDGRTVRFLLNALDLRPPSKLQLTDSEELVEPTFDESGLRFFLVFNNELERLYWLLDEERYVPESFTRHSDALVIGDRTGFAFYPDLENNRKLLVGVYGPNVRWNNWYDGPFDQLLDNYVTTGQVDVRPYLERHDGTAAGKIDRYGRYFEDGQRIAVAPYATYFRAEDLAATVGACLVVESRNERYACLTTASHDLLLDPPFP